VTDGAGNAVSGATVRLQWSNAPANASSGGGGGTADPAFAPVAQTLTSSGAKRAAPLETIGTVSAASPDALAPPILLRVLSVTAPAPPPSTGPPAAFNDGASDMVTEFSWPV
jgi:hypothetical protein